MFLNKPKFIENLLRLINEAETELALIVPYVKMSAEVYEALQNCDGRGVEILLVCREDCMHSNELKRLQKFRHLTLLAHPNLHAKIYINEKSIIIGSMNLYEYSEKFNREAGLLIANNVESHFEGESANDCLCEVGEIISGSEVILASKKVEVNGVNFSILYTKEEKEQDRAAILSTYFATKKFSLLETHEGLHPTCTSFYDQIDAVISHRAVLIPRYPKDILDEIFERYKNIPNNKFDNFRTFIDPVNYKFTCYAEKGESIPSKVYTDKHYAKKLEKNMMVLCKELDHTYKKLR